MDHCFEHDGVRFQYQSIGAGRPFVFCHGLTGDLEHPRQLLGDPPAGWRLIVWDSRFHGLTGPDRSTDKLSFALFASDLAALLDHLQIESAVIGGVSMGAGVATRFAADHPRRAEALVLVRPAWLDQPHPPNLRVLEQAGARMLELDPAEDVAEVWRRFGADPSFVPEAAASPAAAETLRQMCFKPQARERSLRLRAMPASYPIDRHEIARLTMPALVIGNHDDGVHPMALATWWKDALGAAFAEVPSKSHDLQLHEAATRQRVWAFLGGR